MHTSDFLEECMNPYRRSWDVKINVSLDICIQGLKAKRKPRVEGYVYFENLNYTGKRNTGKEQKYAHPCCKCSQRIKWEIICMLILEIGAAHYSFS